MGDDAFDDAEHPVLMRRAGSSLNERGLGAGLLIIDEDNIVVFVNAQYRQMFGLPPEVQIQGLPLHDIVNKLADGGDVKSRHLDDLLSELLDSSSRAGEAGRIVIGASGAVLNLTAAAIPGGGVVFTSSDVTERILARKQRRLADKGAVLALAALAEYRDADTGDHVIRVARMVHEIARTLFSRGQLAVDSPEDFLEHLAISSILHDVGKVAVSDEILFKPGPLTPDERSIMQRHCVIGSALLEKALAYTSGGMFLRLSAEITRYHHERFDGKGYPDGKSRTEIPMSARIVAVADVFDALTSWRPYKEPWPVEEAVAVIAARAGEHFDPVVVDAFLEVMDARRESPLIEWDDAMSVGNAALDRDHQALISVINQLNRGSNRNDPVVLELAFDELLGYFVDHCAREEDLMAASGFGDLPRHRKLHRQMLCLLRGRYEAFSLCQTNDGDEVLEILGSWLREHVLHEDMQYVSKNEERFVTHVVRLATEISTALEAAIDAEEISLAAIFDRNYVKIPGTDPKQFVTGYLGTFDRILTPILDRALTFDDRVAFCCAIDRNGYVPTHNSKYSQAPGPDPVWNLANCRNRRFFRDRVALTAARTTDASTIQVYHRDMGGKVCLMMDVSAPITVRGRHWGGLRLGYTAAVE